MKILMGGCHLFDPTWTTSKTSSRRRHHHLSQMWQQPWTRRWEMQLWLEKSSPRWRLYLNDLYSLRKLNNHIQRWRQRRCNMVVARCTCRSNRQIPRNQSDWATWTRWLLEMPTQHPPVSMRRTRVYDIRMLRQLWEKPRAQKQMLQRKLCLQSVVQESEFMTNTTTTLYISREFWQYIHDHQQLGESKEQTLRRLLGLKESLWLLNNLTSSARTSSNPS